MLLLQCTKSLSLQTLFVLNGVSPPLFRCMKHLIKITYNTPRLFNNIMKMFKKLPKVILSTFLSWCINSRNHTLFSSNFLINHTMHYWSFHGNYSHFYIFLFERSQIPPCGYVWLWLSIYCNQTF